MQAGAAPTIDLGHRFEIVSQLRPDELSRQLVRGDAHDLMLDVAVTLVLLPPDPEPALAEVFEIEAGALTAVGAHPHVPTLYDQLELPTGHQALVLQRHVRPGWPSTSPMDARAAVAIAVKLADALEAAHRVGQLHTAIEPNAIGRSAVGQPLLCGFAVRQDATEPRVLHELTAYTPAELLLGEAPTPATDVYGLASVLYELLSGHAAYRGYDGESPAALGLRILHDPVPRLQELELPIELIDVLDWALASDPALRPPTAAWLAEELGRIERMQDWGRTAPSAPPPAVGAAPDRWTQPRHRRD